MVISLGSAKITDEKVETSKNTIFKNLRISNSEMNKTIIQNSLFAGEFLKTQDITKAEIELFVENYLATKYVKNLLARKDDIPDNVVLSYYYASQEKFKSPLSYDFYMNTFDDKKSADDFVRESRSVPSARFWYEVKSKFQNSFQKYTEKDIPDTLRFYLEAMSVGKLSDPIRLEDKYVVLLLSNKNLPRKLDLSEIKDSIRSELIAKKTLEITEAEYNRLLKNITTAE